MSKNKISKKRNSHKIYLTMFVVAPLMAWFAFQNWGLMALKSGGTTGGGKPKPSPTPMGTPAPSYVASGGELILNGSFEGEGHGTRVPSTWVYHYEQPNRNTWVDCSTSHSGGCSYYINGNKNSAIKQYVNYGAPAGRVVTLSGWGKALAAADTAGHSPGVFWVQAWIHYSDGSTKWDFLKNFNKGTHDYEQVIGTFTLDKPVDGFTVFIRFDGTGEVWFDDISLTVN